MWGPFEIFFLIAISVYAAFFRKGEQAIFASESTDENKKIQSNGAMLL